MWFGRYSAAIGRLRGAVGRFPVFSACTLHQNSTKPPFCQFLKTTFMKQFMQFISDVSSSKLASVKPTDGYHKTFARYARVTNLLLLLLLGTAGNSYGVATVVLTSTVTTTGSVCAPATN